MIVTILTPTLDAERYFAKCLASLAAQTYPRERVQHLVLDGGSADATALLARNAGAEVDVARDVSMYDALNRGLGLVRGEVVGWLNADDTFEPDALRTAVEAFQEAPAAELAVGHYVLASTTGSRLIRTRADALRRIRAGWVRGTWIPPIAVFTRTETLRGLGGYLPQYRIAADLDLWLRAAARTPQPRVTHTGTVIGTFRVHGESLSTGASPERSLRETIEIVRRWSLDPAAPPGVRRHALALLRKETFKLLRWSTRDEPARRRAAAAFECYRDLRGLGRGALYDVRGEVHELVNELVRGALRRKG